MSPDTGYESELTAGREEIAAALIGATDGVLTGTVQLGTGDGATSVRVPDDRSLEIEFEDGEGYTRKHNAQRGPRSVDEGSRDAERSEQSTD